MNWLTHLISWLICIFVAIASIGITGILWWTYYDIRHTSDSKVKWSILEEFVRNETGVYVLAIIATIVMVYDRIKNPAIDRGQWFNTSVIAGLHSCNHLLPTNKTERSGCTVRRSQQMYVLASWSNGSATFGMHCIGVVPGLLGYRYLMLGNGQISWNG